MRDRRDELVLRAHQFLEPPLILAYRRSQPLEQHCRDDQRPETDRRSGQELRRAHDLAGRMKQRELTDALSEEVERDLRSFGYERAGRHDLGVTAFEDDAGERGDQEEDNPETCHRSQQPPQRQHDEGVDAQKRAETRRTTGRTHECSQHGNSFDRHGGNKPRTGLHGCGDGDERTNEHVRRGPGANGAPGKRTRTNR